MTKYILPKEAQNPNQQYIIYGTGEVARQYYYAMKQIMHSDNIICFIDSAPMNKQFNGKRVLSLKEFKNSTFPDPVKYIIASISGANEIASNLRKLSISEERLIFPEVDDNRAYFGSLVNLTSIRKIVYYPEVTSNRVLDDILNRIEWYIPSTDIEITIPISNNISKLTVEKVIKFVDKNLLSETLDQANLILVWDQSAFYNDELKSLPGKVLCVDPSFYYLTESEIYRKLYFWTLSESEQEIYAMKSIKNFDKFAEKNSNKKVSYVFGTGPSIEQALNFDFKGGLNIICNSLVKNKKLIKHIRPDLLAFADPVFHFSYVEYAKKFRIHAIEFLLKNEAFCVVPDYTVPLIVRHYPFIADRIIGIPTFGSVFNYPDRNNFFVRGTNNILTFLMLPIATSLTDKIMILGCDGRQQGETYFWKHNTSTQYTELMETVFKAHPSFFRDRKYEDYYETHCNLLDELIEAGEKAGKQYVSLTRSLIPVLSKRMIGETI